MKGLKSTKDVSHSRHINDYLLFSSSFMQSQYRRVKLEIWDLRVLLGPFQDIDPNFQNTKFGTLSETLYLL